AGFTEYKTNKVYEVATVVMNRKKMVFGEVDQRILEHVFNETAQYRNY
ncbi:MAG: glucose-1-phosphate thymidylyltransferase, partial [Flavobacteriales bacterium]